MRIRPAVLLAALAGGPAACGWSAPPAPAQPIRFSHRVHVGENLVGCTSCHAYAERSPVAGIPSMQRCQGCHRFVKEDPQNARVTGEIKALLARIDEGAPIRWVRVHRLPDHVFFTHERHVRNGVRCEECHGKVEAMDEDRQVAPLTMGWCLDCHHARRAAADCLTCHR